MQILMTALVSSVAALTEPSGSICLSGSAEVPANIHNGAASALSYDVRVDGERFPGSGSPVTTDRPDSVIGGLSLAGVHSVTISRLGRRLQSFSFRFADFEEHTLCLWHNALYDSWSLWNRRQAAGLCRCAAD